MYWHRRRVPADLKAAYEGRSPPTTTVNTRNPEEARRRHAAMADEVSRRWSTLPRRANRARPAQKPWPSQGLGALQADRRPIDAPAGRSARVRPDTGGRHSASLPGSGAQAARQRHRKQVVGAKIRGGTRARAPRTVSRPAPQTPRASDSSRHAKTPSSQRSPRAP
ncbi:DUF6538 domain-containing protein [Methylopila jiangsuensis]|uniref:DUF6538 domain-containing protein n=1 Tax=Methylopila jiangsuensis TaxID=586230 RepID=UPI003D17F5E5